VLDQPGGAGVAQDRGQALGHRHPRRGRVEAGRVLQALPGQPELGIGPGGGVGSGKLPDARRHRTSLAEQHVGPPGTERGEPRRQLGKQGHGGVGGAPGLQVDRDACQLGVAAASELHHPQPVQQAEILSRLDGRGQPPQLQPVGRLLVEGGLHVLLPEVAGQPVGVRQAEQAGQLPKNDHRWSSSNPNAAGMCSPSSARVWSAASSTSRQMLGAPGGA
jgi:hypothetical protein